MGLDIYIADSEGDINHNGKCVALNQQIHQSIISYTTDSFTPITKLLSNYLSDAHIPKEDLDNLKIELTNIKSDMRSGCNALNAIDELLMLIDDAKTEGKGFYAACD